jgi:hypothetical protein
MSIAVKTADIYLRNWFLPVYGQLLVNAAIPLMWKKSYPWWEGYLAEDTKKSVRWNPAAENED